MEGAEAEVLWGVAKGLLDHRLWFLVMVHSPPELGMVKNEGWILDCYGQLSNRAYYLAGKVFLKLHSLWPPEAVVICCFSRMGRGCPLGLPPSTKYDP